MFKPETGRLIRERDALQPISLAIKVLEMLPLSPENCPDILRLVFCRDRDAHSLHLVGKLAPCHGSAVGHEDGLDKRGDLVGIASPTLKAFRRPGNRHLLLAGSRCDSLGVDPRGRR